MVPAAAGRVFANFHVRRDAHEGDRFGRMAEGVARAVGGACGSNPIAIVIPCHRVIGSAGLTGFSGGKGVETKQALLDLERGQTRLGV